MQWVASFVPVAVVFAADDVQEVAGGEGKVLRWLACGCVVVVESLDDLKSDVLARARGVKGSKWRWAVGAVGVIVGWERTFLGGSMAMASLCGMEICTGLAESCFEESLLMERRNYESGQLFRCSATPVGRTTMAATHLDHDCSFGGDASRARRAVGE